MSQNKKNQSGISLFLATIIMTIVLAIVLGLSTILASQMRITKGMEDSVIAFYAADAGIEEILEKRENPTATCTTEDNPCSLGKAGYFIKIYSSDSDDCSAPNYCIKSFGIYNNVRRAIEINY